MTANEMAYQFDVLYDKVASESSPGYTAKEKSVFLSKAQSVLINDYIKEFSETNRRNFDNIIKNIDITTQSSIQDTGKPNGIRYDIPSDLMYIIGEEVTISHSDACFNNKRIMVIPIPKDSYTININNPHRKPKVTGNAYDCVWRLDFTNDTNGNKRVELITDGTFTISKYHLTYLKTPVDIVPVITGDSSTTTQVDSELNDTAHTQIVDIAVRIATGVTSPELYKMKLTEEQLDNQHK